jgi:hypothetical protein
MYDWEVRRVSASKLAAGLESASANGFEVFAILPAGEDPSLPPPDRYGYLIVARRPKQQ